MPETKYIYPRPPTRAEVKRLADERYQAMLDMLNQREEKRRKDARPKCHQIGWKPDNSANLN